MLVRPDDVDRKEIRSPKRQITVPLKWKSGLRRIQLTPPEQLTDEGFHEKLVRHTVSAVAELSSTSNSLQKSYQKHFSTPEPHVTDLFTVDMDLTPAHLKKPISIESFHMDKDKFKKTHCQVSHPDSFFASMRPVLYIFQVFALLPVSGISGPGPDYLKFKWLHWKIIYVFFSIFGIFFLFVCSLALCFRFGFSYDRSAPLVFYASAVIGILQFLFLARHWADLNKRFAQTELLLLDHGYPQGQGRKFLIITFTFTSLAFVEHCLSKLVDVIKILPCQRDGDHFNKILETFFLNQYYQVFSLVDYNIVLGILTLYFNINATVCWNLTDLFLGLMGLSLSSRLRQINQHLTSVCEQRKPSSFWRKAREEFNALSVLTKKVDERIQGIMLLSLGDNLFFICLQLLKSLKQRINPYQVVYFFWSFGFLIMRACFVTLCASDIFDESREGKTVLYSVPPDNFCHEVQRFLTQLSTDELVFTGCRFFSVTRGLILTIAGTVVTYEIVLVQFKTDTGVEDWPSDTNRTNCTTMPHA